MPRSRGVTFVNAADVQSLRVVGCRIASVNEAVCPGDVVIDLRQDRLLPGLINAHDHLQLNTLPPLASPRRYEHVRDWIEEVDAHRRQDAQFASLIAVSRDDRLLIGGIKNLLSGVTTVAHHDPFYPSLSGFDFPVRVVSACGWSHSLYLDGEAQVRASHTATPPDQPWIIHAAEGLNAAAVAEFDRLEMLGCLRQNTLLVHGVALDRERRTRLQRAGAGLVWCPASNLRLFGRTAEIEDLAGAGRVALGTDSRLSGARDLLEELQVARQYTNLDDRGLEQLVTTRSAALLRLSNRGSLRAGCLADLVVLPAGAELSRSSRADVRLVVLGGVARYADEEYARALGPPEIWSPIRVDGRSKQLASSLATALLTAKCVEPGLELPAVTWRAA